MLVLANCSMHAKVGGGWKGQKFPVLSLTCSFPSQFITDTWTDSRDKRGARWKCLYLLRAELGLAVQLVSSTQTADNGNEPSDLAFTAADLAPPLSGPRLGVM